MKIFLSWSGERSKVVASALRGWLPLVLHYADPWLSQRDIQAGDRWSVELGNELNNNNFGIICLTPENLTAPWILFEAGAISKSFSQGAICPYLYDVDHSDISGPLQQFQSKKADRPSTKELVESINSKSATPVDPIRLNTIFNTFWSSLEDQLSKIPSESLRSQQPHPQPEVLEDLVKSVRAMEGNVRELSNIITNRHEVGRTFASPFVRFEGKLLPIMKFVLVTGDESVGNLQPQGRWSFQSSPIKLI